MPRKTDASKPADWLAIAEADLADPADPLVTSLTEAYFTDRYPGFDLDDPDWPALQKSVETVGELIEKVRGQLTSDR